MTDAELRALVRDAVGRHLGTGQGLPAAAHAPRAHAPGLDVLPSPPFTTRGPDQGPSHGKYLMLVNPGDACLIEPSVRCNHCGYCQSHGY